MCTVVLTSEIDTACIKALNGGGVCPVQGLRDLCMTACKLEACPLELPALTALSNLNLSSNLIYDVPSSMKSLAHLSTFNLRRNRLNAMPAVILQLTALAKLDVSENDEFQFTPTAVEAAKLPRLQSFAFPTPCRDCAWSPMVVCPSSLSGLCHVSAIVVTVLNGLHGTARTKALQCLAQVRMYVCMVVRTCVRELQVHLRLLLE